MDPYLESPKIWPDVHHELISQIRAKLNPNLRPKYIARVELRIYKSDDYDPGRVALVPDLRVQKRTKPANGKYAKTPSSLAIAEPLKLPALYDDEIKEAFLTIVHLKSKSLVTIIELLSPTNKINGSSGRDSFLKKRQDVMASNVHWVEIDLLRGGEPSLPQPPLMPSDYRVIMSRAGEPRQTCYWPFDVRDELPVVGIPLRGRDPDAPLDLAAVFDAAYEIGEYDASVDYRKSPEPPLKGRDAKWARTLLRSGK
jgi:hypothetical protein